MFSSSFSEDDSEIELKHCKSSRIPLSRRENILCTKIELNEHTVPSEFKSRSSQPGPD